ncbi:MAG TPA: TlpA disulfide reductase family protein [Bacteroidales bacterium]|nr:TlpA disulfide reductase family protein [Bacteroidales bacterium]
MMRWCVMFLFFTIFAFSGCQNNTVNISGSITNPVSGEYIYLDELSSDKLEPVDSFMITDGTFKLKAETRNPSFYLLRFNSNNFLTMVVEPGQKINVEVHHDSLNYPSLVEGSEGTMLLSEYNDKLRGTIDKMKSLNRIYEENENNPGLPELMNSLDSMAQENLNEINSYTKDYIDKNINSLASLVALYQQVAPGVYVLDQVRDWKYFAKVDSSLYLKYPEYAPVATLHEQVKELKSSLGLTTGSLTDQNAIAPDIILPTPEGDTVKLSSTRGSYVLVDFWASWCPPCRVESPNLVKAYDQFHRKGFQIYQVSLDKTKEAWIKGIEDDKLGRWIHVSDIQYWNSVVVPLYKIESIPANFLLDREGRIIATNLRGERLQEKLAEVFSKR